MVQAKNLHVASERHDDSKLRMAIICFQNFQNLTGHSFFLAQKIHVSQDTKNLLIHLSGYSLEFRGHVDVKVCIKGK